MGNWVRLLLLTLAFSVLVLFAGAACDVGDDDGDDDDGDDDNGDDDDDDGYDCVDDVRDAAEDYCAGFGLGISPGAGLDYSYAECDIYCGGAETYYDSECAGGTCVCCE